MTRLLPSVSANASASAAGSVAPQQPRTTPPICGQAGTAHALVQAALARTENTRDVPVKEQENETEAEQRWVQEERADDEEKGERYFDDELEDEAGDDKGEGDMEEGGEKVLGEDIDRKSGNGPRGTVEKENKKAILANSLHQRELTGTRRKAWVVKYMDCNDLC